MSNRRKYLVCDHFLNRISWPDLQWRHLLRLRESLCSGSRLLRTSTHCHWRPRLCSCAKGSDKRLDLISLAKKGINFGINLARSRADRVSQILLWFIALHCIDLYTQLGHVCLDKHFMAGFFQIKKEKVHLWNSWSNFYAQYNFYSCSINLSKASIHVHLH